MNPLDVLDIASTSISAFLTTVLCIVIWIGTRYRTPPLPQTVAENKCTVIIPCYLPNEQYIIVDTVTRLMHHEAIERILVVYNTPCKLAVETTLQKMHTERFHSFHVTCSNSRAENISFALSNCNICTATTLLLDADHHCDSEAIRVFIAEYERKAPSVACIQGMLIARGNSLCALIVSAIGLLSGFHMQIAARTLTGTALFTGAAALWSTDVLKTLGIRRFMSEDMDLSFRLIQNGMTVQETIYAYVTELEPASVMQLVMQRMRWTSGFEECRRMHWCKILRANPRAFLIFVFTDVSYAMAFLTICHTVVSIGYQHTPTQWILLPVGASIVSSLSLAALTMYIVSQTPILRPHARTFLGAVVISPAYLLFHLLLLIGTYLRMPCPMSPHVTRRPREKTIMYDGPAEIIHKEADEDALQISL